MLARKALSKKKIILYTGTMVVVWGIIGILLYRNYAPSKKVSQPIVLTPTSVAGDVEAPAGTKPPADFSLLRAPELTNLLRFGEVPLEIKALGNKDPFGLITP